MPKDIHKWVEETRRRQHMTQRIDALEAEIEELNTQIAEKNKAVAMLIRARTLSIDKARRSE